MLLTRESENQSTGQNTDKKFRLLLSDPALILFFRFLRGESVSFFLHCKISVNTTILVMFLSAFSILIPIAEFFQTKLEETYSREKHNLTFFQKSWSHRNPLGDPTVTDKVLPGTRLSIKKDTHLYSEVEKEREGGREKREKLPLSKLMVSCLSTEFLSLQIGRRASSCSRRSVNLDVQASIKIDRNCDAQETGELKGLCWEHVVRKFFRQELQSNRKLTPLYFPTIIIAANTALFNIEVVCTKITKNRELFSFHSFFATTSKNNNEKRCRISTRTGVGMRLRPNFQPEIFHYHSKFATRKQYWCSACFLAKGRIAGKHCSFAAT